MNIANLILDLVVVAVVVIGLISGWRRGFIRIVLKTFAGLFSVIISLNFFEELGAVLKEKYVLPYISDKIAEAVESGAGGGAAQLVDSVPAEWQNVANLVGIDLNSMAQNAANSGQNAMQQFVSSASESVAQFVSMVAAFVLLAFVSYFVLRILAVVLSKIIGGIPVISTVNKVLGLIFGLIVSAMLCWIFVQLVGFLADSMNLTFLEMNSTLISKLLYNFHPLNFILGGK